jgi:hypothetical protein
MPFFIVFKKNLDKKKGGKKSHFGKDNTHHKRTNILYQLDIKRRFKGNCEACYPEFIEGYRSLLNHSSINSGRQYLINT